MTGVFALLLAALLTVLATVPALGAPPAAVEVKLAQSTLRVGDQVSLRVSVTLPSQAVVDFPDLNGKLGSVEIVRFQLLPGARALDGSTTTTGEYIITSFVPGNFNIPPITVTYTTPDGAKTTVTSTGELTIEVRSVLNSGNSTLRDIKPPLSLAREPLAYLSTGAYAMLGISGAALATLLIRRARRRTGIAAIFASTTPESIAHEELDHISELDLIEQGKYIQYCGLISSCVRQYLDDRYTLGTSSATTTEIRAVKLKQALDPWQIRVITGLLEECDSVRWAHYTPNPQRAARLLSTAHEIVDLSRNAPESAEQDDPLSLSTRISGK